MLGCFALMGDTLASLSVTKVSVFKFRGRFFISTCKEKTDIPRLLTCDHNDAGIFSEAKPYLHSVSSQENLQRNLSIPMEGPLRKIDTHTVPSPRMNGRAPHRVFLC